MRIDHGSVRNDHGSRPLIGFLTGVLENRFRVLCDTGSGIEIREKTTGIADFRPDMAGRSRIQPETAKTSKFARNKPESAIDHGFSGKSAL